MAIKERSFNSSTLSPRLFFGPLPSGLLTGARVQGRRWDVMKISLTVPPQVGRFAAAGAAEFAAVVLPDPGDPVGSAARARRLLARLATGEGT
jgi:hypothetical protein